MFVMNHEEPTCNFYGQTQFLMSLAQSTESTFGAFAPLRPCLARCQHVTAVKSKFSMLAAGKWLRNAGEPG